MATNSKITINSGNRKSAKAKKRPRSDKDHSHVTALHHIINDVTAKNYQESYIKWLTDYAGQQIRAPSTDSPPQSASSAETGVKHRTVQEKRKSPLPTEPGYDWRTYQKHCRGNAERKKAQTKLLRENRKVHRRLQQKRERQCYEPTEDWTEDLWEPATWINAATQANLPPPEEPTPIIVVEDKPVQTSRSNESIAIQTDNWTSLRTATTQTVEFTSKTTRATQTAEPLGPSISSVSVFPSQKQKFEYWSHRREQLKHELDVAKVEIDNMLSDLLVQLNALTQPTT